LPAKVPIRWRAFTLPVEEASNKTRIALCVLAVSATKLHWPVISGDVEAIDPDV
jgi:hypothetical protein